MKKSERLQMIIMLLKQKGKQSASDLAEYIEVSTRTIYRDIDALSQMHVPIISLGGINGGYEVDETYFMPALRLSEREVLILMLLLKVSGQLNLPDFSENVNALNLKLHNACQDSAAQFEKMLQHVTVDIRYIFPKPHLQGAFETILEAFDRQVNLRIQYHTPLKNSVTERVISPLHLFFSEGGWYLDAYCHIRAQKRTFRLDRIQSVALLSDMPNAKLNEQYTDTISDDQEQLLKFDIDKNLYNLIKDDSPMKNANLVSESSTSCRVHVRTNRLVYFETLAIRNIEQITILEPQPFVQELRKKILAAIQKYQ